MTTYAVYEPPGTQSGSFAAADGSAFVKDGWSWPAFFIPPIWLLWRRMWLPFLLWLAANVVIAVAAAAMDWSGGVTFIVSTAFALWFALEANALRRWSLARQGWRFAGLSTGADQGEAELLYFSRRSPVGTSSPAKAAAMPAPTRPGESVIGVFPEPWTTAR
jgi:hypothetical protein